VVRINSFAPPSVGHVQHRFCNVRWCIANHFLCSCVCDMDHESTIKYHYYYYYYKPDKDIQKLLSNGNRIWIRVSETLLSIFRGFRILEKVAHCTVIHLLSSEAFQPSAPWLRVCLWSNLWTVEWVMPSLSAWICSWCGKIGLSVSVH